MSTQAEPAVTPEAYLAMERRAPHRSEYVNGRIRALPTSNRAHNLIMGNLAAELLRQLRGRDGEVYVKGIRVKVAATGMYAYPDVIVVRAEPRFEDVESDTLLNPTLIVEVLSESTERYDRGDKFAHYRRLESLQEYVLVAQHRPLVERFARQGDAWVLTAVEGMDATIALPSVGCTLALRDVYERVEFPPDAGKGVSAE